MTQTSPIRQRVRHFFAQFDGPNYDLTIALLYEGIPKRCEVGLILAKPGRILCVPGEIIDYYPRRDTIFGTYGPPGTSAVFLPRSPHRRAIRLLDIISSGRNGLPHHIIFERKTGVYSGP